MLTIRHCRAHNPVIIRACQICDEPLLRHQQEYCTWHEPQTDIHKCECCHAPLSRPRKSMMCMLCCEKIRNLDDDGKVIFRKKMAIGNMSHDQAFALLQDNRTDLPVARKRDKTLPIYTKMLDLVSKELGISKRRISKDLRFPDIVRARAVIAKGMIDKGYRITTIGRLLGDMHHTTVSNMRDRFNEYCQQDPRLEGVLNKIKEIA